MPLLLMPFQLTLLLLTPLLLTPLLPTLPSMHQLLSPIFVVEANAIPMPTRAYKTIGQFLQEMPIVED